MTERDDTLDTFEARLRAAFGDALSQPLGEAELVDVLAGTALAILDDDACNRYAEQVVNETHLKAIDFRNGMAMELEPSRDMVAAWVGAARGMLGDAPNYTETPIEMEVKVGESPESFVFILQRVGKLTPHQGRLRAEARVAELEQCQADHLAEINQTTNQLNAVHATAIEWSEHCPPDNEGMHPTDMILANAGRYLIALSRACS